MKHAVFAAPIVAIAVGLAIAAALGWPAARAEEQVKLTPPERAWVRECVSRTGALLPLWLRYLKPKVMP